MNSSLRTFLGLSLLVAPLAAGCASRTAPFNDMDQAQITVLRLGGLPQPQMTTTTATTGALPTIPGIPPELAAAGQQILQGVNQAAPGLIPPGLIPGQQGTTTTTTQPPPPTFQGFVILAQMPVPNDDMKNEILDIFGDEDSFNQQAAQCFNPGLGISISRPNQPMPVDLLVSYSCNQAKGTGFSWPYKSNGLTADTSQKLQKIYSQLFGMAPPPNG